MSIFNYPLPEQAPSQPLRGLSSEALTSLSEMAVGPRPAEQLLAPEVDEHDTDTESAPMVKDLETLKKESWEEMERFAEQMYPTSTGAQKRFLEDFGLIWSPAKEEPLIVHWKEGRGHTRIADFDYTLTLPPYAHTGGVDLALPSNLDIRKLVCGAYCGFRVTRLPDRLVELSCSDNAMVRLPRLPDGLVSLECGGNQLQTLPDLPDSLQKLDCANNKLTKLPDLPDSLTTVDCRANDLTALPVLPSGLTRLESQYNPLVALPDLPPSLEYLDCSFAELIDLPYLPDSLQKLICRSNYIKTLPSLPINVKCNFLLNPLDDASRKRLKKHNRRRTFGL